VNAVKWARASSATMPTSMVVLGNAYAEGKGVEKNPEEAERWYKRGAETGDLWSQYLYGMSFEQKQNPERGIVWLKASADKGFFNSLLVLANIQLYGIFGQPANVIEGIRLHNKLLSDFRNDANSAWVLGEFFAQGPRQYRDREKALSYLKRAVDMGFPGADVFYKKVLASGG
jgi:uncharacterized protein